MPFLTHSLSYFAGCNKAQQQQQKQPPPPQQQAASHTRTQTAKQTPKKPEQFLKWGEAAVAWQVPEWKLQNIFLYLMWCSFLAGSMLQRSPWGCSSCIKKESFIGEYSSRAQKHFCLL